jgi:hypothetical protein
MTASSSRRHAGDDDHGNRATPLCGTQLDPNRGCEPVSQPWRAPPSLRARFEAVRRDGRTDCGAPCGSAQIVGVGQVLVIVVVGVAGQQSIQIAPGLGEDLCDLLLLGAAARTGEFLGRHRQRAEFFTHAAQHHGVVGLRGAAGAIRPGPRPGYARAPPRVSHPAAGWLR